MPEHRRPAVAAGRPVAAGASFGWDFKADGKLIGSIGMRAEPGALVLSYRLNDVPMKQRAPILTTACNYGGERAWLGCPRCGARVALLYLRSDFTCRKCSRIVYWSQSEDATGRDWRKQRKSEAKMGDSWRRPKGMHQATHRKLIATIMDCEHRRDLMVDAYMQRNFTAGADW